MFFQTLMRPMLNILRVVNAAVRVLAKFFKLLTGLLLTATRISDAGKPNLTVKIKSNAKKFSKKPWPLPVPNRKKQFLLMTWWNMFKHFKEWAGTRFIAPATGPEWG